MGKRAGGAITWIGVVAVIKWTQAPDIFAEGWESG